MLSKMGIAAINVFSHNRSPNNSFGKYAVDMEIVLAIPLRKFGSSLF
jgi:hypothetical protein